MKKRCLACGRKHEENYIGECRNPICGVDLSKPRNFELVSDELINESVPSESHVETKPSDIIVYYRQCLVCSRFYPFSIDECSCNGETKKLVTPTRGLTLKHLESGRDLLIIPKDETILGRQATYSEFFTSNEISRQHFKILFEDGLPYILDEKSSNRTFLNNLVLTYGQKYALKKGQLIKVGKAPGFTFEVN